MARPPRDRSTLTLGAVGVVATLAMAFMFRPPPRVHRGPELRVPHAAASAVIDGEVDEAAWRGEVASTGFLLGVDGQRMTASSVRMVWKDDLLYVLLYAADADIRATITTPDAPLWPEDAFRLTFNVRGDPRARVIYVSPLGTVTDEYVRGDAVDTSWQSGAEVGHDIDGTPNDPRDDDEEWVIEMAIPLSSIGLGGGPGERVGFSARRCDVPKGAGRRCGAWGEPDGEIVLLP